MLGMSGCFIFEVHRGWGECWNGVDISRGKKTGRDIFEIVEDDKKEGFARKISLRRKGSARGKGIIVGG